MAHSTPGYDGAFAAPSTTVTTSVPASRKRKREKSVLGDCFVIKPHSSSVFDSSVKLIPTVALPRSYMPLQWLAGYPSRLFSIPTRIPALDVPGSVVIVKVEGERQLSAVEQVEGDVCTLYKLSTQLKMKDVRKTVSLAKKSRQNSESFSSTDSKPEILSSEWWSGLEAPYFDIDNAICGTESTVNLVMGPSDFSTCNDRTLSLPPLPNAPLSPPVAADITLEMAQNLSEPTLLDILEKTRVQYFKTLYIAKTSLAYFAKSTLSRARVAVQQENKSPSSSDSSSELRAFLLEMYLPFKKMDIKYRKSIVQIATEDPVDDMTVFRPGEEDYVQQWRVAAWEERLIQANDPTVKRKVEELKIRETELQIIILLEILALEREQAASTKELPNEDQPSKRKSRKGSKKKGKIKSKANTQEPNLLLDLLVDRLCIWGSIGSSPDELEEESSGQKKVTDREYDHLRHFCVEVVLAFYASRLPEECASINKKCGGSNSRPRTPGHPKKERKPQTKKPPILRAITAPTAAPGAREASVDTLAALVAADAASLPRGAVRGGTLNCKSFAKREVQITSRSRQLKKVDEELKDAINTLERPNRITTASELVDESIKRTSSNKKSKKPARNPLAKIQVMATPKRRGMIMPPQPPLPSVTENSHDLRVHDPSYVHRIPDPRTQGEILGTPLRQDSRLDFDMIPSTSPFEVSSEARRTTTLPGGFITPQKKQRRSMGTDLGSGNFVPSSATKITETFPRTSAPLVAPSGISKFMAQQNPFGQVDDDTSSPAGGVMLFNADVVGETPCKASTIAPVVEGKKEISIYDSLGWDDDYDL